MRSAETAAASRPRHSRHRASALRRRMSPSCSRSPAARHSSKCPLVGVRGGGETVHQAQFVGQFVISGGERRGRLVASKAQRPLELRRGFAVRAKLGGPAPGQRRVVQRGGPDRRPPRRGRPAGRGPRSRSHAAQSGCVRGWRHAVPGNRLFRRAAGDLVPEPQRCRICDQQARFSQLIYYPGRGGRGPLEQSRLYRGADQRRDTEHPTRLWPEPGGAGQHRVPS